MTVYCCSVSLCNCESAPPALSLNLSTPLCIRWEIGLLGARWLLPEVVSISGTSSWNVHFQCRGGSSFILLRGLSLPNISGQGVGKIYYLHTSNAYTLNRRGGWRHKHYQKY